LPGGARLFGKASAMPDLAMITAGSLDDPTQYTPQMDIFYFKCTALGS
jgi:hypothetical protein